MRLAPPVAVVLAALFAVPGASLPQAPVPAGPADAAMPAAPALEVGQFPSLAAALASLGRATGFPLSAPDAERVDALESRLVPEAADAITQLAAALAAASRAQARPDGDAARLAAAAQTVREAAAHTSHVLQGLLRDGGCAIDCPQPGATHAAPCPPVVACRPLPVGVPQRCPGLDPNFKPNCFPACPAGQAGVPPLCIPPPAPCPAGSSGIPPLCVPYTPAPSPCAAAAGLLAPFTVAPLLSIGSVANEGFDQDVLLSIDFGGDDAYCNNAGSTHSAGPPHNVLPRDCITDFTPVAVLLDLAGNDAYHSVYKGIAETDVDAVFCFEGASTFGIAWFQDVAGDDAYNSGHLVMNAGLAQAWCAQFKPNPYPAIVVPTGTAYYDAETNQGATIGGFAFLSDRDGDDQYNSNNVVCTRYYAGPCLVIHLAQGGAHMLPGLGIMRDEAGNDQYNSHNLVDASFQNILPLPTAKLPPSSCPPQTALVLPEDAKVLIREVQGVAIGGIGELVDDAGNDVYNTGNSLRSDWGLNSGLVTFPRTQSFAIECTQGCGVFGGRGHHLDGGVGDDRYNDANSINMRQGAYGQSAYLAMRCFQGATAEGAPYPAETHCVAADPFALCVHCGDPEDLVVPATLPTTRGSLEDGGGDDRYNSGNSLTKPAWVGTVALTIKQGQGSSEGGEARFVEDSGTDRFNQGNNVPGAMEIQAVQGNVRSFAGTGIMLSDEGMKPALGGPGGDDYNGGNNARLTITYAQASSSAPPGSVAMARLHDHAGSDKYNSGNFGATATAGVLAAVGQSPTYPSAVLPGVVPHGGFVAFADDAGSDLYDATAGTIGWAVCVAPQTAGLGVTFLDQNSAGDAADTWDATAAPGGSPKYNNPGGIGIVAASAVPPGNCKDTGDGAEMPPNTFGADT
jgi:hypothetical protein